MFRCVLVGALFLTGCAQTTWVKEGVTQQDYISDSYECEKDTRQSGYYGTGLVGTLNMQNFFKECMYAHGYTLQSNEGGEQPNVSESNILNTETVQGNKRVSDEKLLHLLTMKIGDRVNSEAVFRDLKSIQDFYAASGVKAKVAFHEPYNDNGKTDVIFMISEEQ